MDNKNIDKKKNYNENKFYRNKKQSKEKIIINNNNNNRSHINEINKYRLNLNKFKNLFIFKEGEEYLIIVFNYKALLYLHYNYKLNEFSKFNDFKLDNFIENIVRINDNLFIYRNENFKLVALHYKNKQFFKSENIFINQKEYHEYNEYKITNMKFCKKNNNLIFSFCERNFFILKLYLEDQKIKVIDYFYYTPHDLYVTNYEIFKNRLYSFHFKKILILSEWKEEKNNYEVKNGIKFDELISNFYFEKELLFIGFSNLYVSIIDNELLEIIVSYKILNEKNNKNNTIEYLKFINKKDKRFNHKYLYEKNKFNNYLQESYFFVIDKYNNGFKIKNKNNFFVGKIKKDKSLKNNNFYVLDNGCLLFCDCFNNKKENNVFIKIIKLDKALINELELEAKIDN